MKSALPSHLAVLGANLIYGANYTIAKHIMPSYIEPFGFIVIRVLFAAPLFFIAAMAAPRQKFSRKDFLMLPVLAIFGVAVNQLLFFKGLSLTSPINAGLMMTTNPIMVLIIAHFLIREKISWLKIAGIILGLSGAVLLITSGQKFYFDEGMTEGNIMVLINSLSYAIFLVMVKPLMERYHYLHIMKWVFFFGIIIVLPFGYTEAVDARWRDLDFSGWAAVVFVVAGTTFFAYLLNISALRTLSPSVVSNYIYLQPLFAASVAIVLGKDSLNYVHVLSALLLFAGVYLVTKSTASSFAIKQ